MEHDHGHDAPPNEFREFRLEGVGLYVVGALFLAALAGAFYLGRWVESRSAGSLPAGSPVADGGAGGVALDAEVDVASDTTYFDTVSGGDKEAEPQREMPVETPPDAGSEKLAMPAATQSPERTASREAEPDSGPFYVQLFAGRDRSSAESLVKSLNEQGYRVRLDTERSGQGALYKVRVGGYAAKPDAQVLAERLRTAGYSGAWVTRVD